MYLAGEALPLLSLNKFFESLALLVLPAGGIFSFCVVRTLLGSVWHKEMVAMMLVASKFGKPSLLECNFYFFTSGCWFGFPTIFCTGVATTTSWLPIASCDVVWLVSHAVGCSFSIVWLVSNALVCSSTVVLLHSGGARVFSFCVVLLVVSGGAGVVTGASCWSFKKGQAMLEQAQVSTILQNLWLETVVFLITYTI